MKQDEKYWVAFIVYMCITLIALILYVFITLWKFHG